MTVDRLVSRLQLLPHPEGGYYRETWRSEQMVTVQRGTSTVQRPAMTSIYFLLRTQDHSCLHRILSDELWHFVQGDPLTVHRIHLDGRLQYSTLGNVAGLNHECVVTAGEWFGATVMPGEHGYSLVSCVVAPGFDFQDFEMGDDEALVRQFPHAAALINRLSRRRQ
jgi:predicted cupin superfamily sugar epimerase